jgi:hypothetical protein
MGREGLLEQMKGFSTGLRAQTQPREAREVRKVRVLESNAKYISEYN